MIDGQFSFVEYLTTLSPLKLDKLYESMWTCQAVLRSLPPVAKQYVLRLLYVDQPLPSSTFDSWASVEGTSKHKVAIESLLSLRVLVEASDR
jgi:transcription initiation factor TFIIH subunit 4